MSSLPHRHQQAHFASERTRAHGAPGSAQGGQPARNPGTTISSPSVTHFVTAGAQGVGPGQVLGTGHGLEEPLVPENRQKFADRIRLEACVNAPSPRPYDRLRGSMAGARWGRSP